MTVDVTRGSRNLLLEASRQADAVRRTSTFTLQMTAMLLACGLLPRLPGAHLVLGELTVPRAFACILPGTLLLWINLGIYRKFATGSETWRRLYQFSETFEMFFLFGMLHGFVYASGQSVAIAWALMPFCAAFWADLKPGGLGWQIPVTTAAHGCLSIALWVQHDFQGAQISFVLGIVCIAVSVAVARARLRSIVLEAERNRMKEELEETRLDAFRAQTIENLLRTVSKEIEAIADDIDPLSARQAHALGEELARVSSSSIAVDNHTPTLGTLVKRIDEKCQPLCEGLDYQLTLRGTESTRCSAHTELAVLRVAQELVRNAVVHGGGKAIEVAVSSDAQHVLLDVLDNGVGLSHAAFVQATGGLRNASRWLAEHAGELDLRSPGDANTKTHLRARIAIF